jgi:hypothetical protein
MISPNFRPSPQSKLSVWKSTQFLWPERLQGSDKGSQAKEAVSAMEECCAPPTGAASGHRH